MATFLKQLGGNNQIRIFIAILGLLFLVVYFNKEIFVSVGPGQSGVLWKRFGSGTVLDKVYPEGTHVNAPWNKLYRYTTRVQEALDTVKVLSSNGLPLAVRLSTRFHPERDSLPRLHQRLGPGYVDTVVRPEMTSAVRRVVGAYTPEELYAKDEAELLQEIDQEARDELAQFYVALDNVRILELTMPEQLQAAVETKLVQEQAALTYEHRLEVERYEKQRRLIEAEGIRLFEQASGISFLHWRSLEEAAAIARSPNAKIVVLGRDAQGLPLLFDPEKPPADSQ